MAVRPSPHVLISFASLAGVLTLATLGGSGLVACRAAHEDAEGADGRISSGSLSASAEKSLDVPAGTAGMRASRLAMSRGAADGLLVWQSDEVSSDPAKGELVYAAPISSAGTIAAPAGNPLFEGGHAAREELSLDFDGTNHALMTAQSGSVTLRRVSPEGRLLDRAPVIVASSPLRDAALTFDGTNHLVVWASDGNTDHVRAARFGRDLARIGSDLDLGIVGGAPRTLRAAGARGVSLVGWVDDPPNKVNLKRIGPDGTVTDVSDALPRDATTVLAIAGGDDDFLVVRRTQNADRWQLDVRSIGADGQAIDGPSTLASSRDELSDPKVSFDGSRYLVSWLDGESSRVAMKYVNVGPNGASVTPAETPAAVEGSGHHGALALSATSVLVVTENVARGLSAHRLDGSLAVSETMTVGVRDSLQEVRGIAASKDGHLVVYSDDRVAPSFPMVPQRVFVQTVASDGEKQGKPIALGDDYAADASFAVASDGQDFLVLDERRASSAEIRARRVGKDGAVIDTKPIQFAAPSSTRATTLVWDGTYYSALFTTTFGDKLYRTRIGRDGEVLDANPVALATAPADTTIQSVNAAAFDNVLVIGWRQQSETGANDRLFALRKVGEGRPESLELGDLATGDTFDGIVAAGGREALIASKTTAFGIARDGAPRSITGWATPSAPAAIGLLFDGTSFLRVGPRLDAATGTQSFTLAPLDPTGATVGEATLTLVAGRGLGESTLPIAGGYGGRALTAYAPVANGARLSGLRFRSITNKTPSTSPGDDGGVIPPKGPDAGSGITIEPAAPSESKGSLFGPVPAADASAEATCAFAATPGGSSFGLGFLAWGAGLLACRRRRATSTAK